jgi:hypothetical protein
MKALIQHNFTSGFGDCLICIFEYLDTVNLLKEKGYSVTLKLNLKNNVYFDSDMFFEFFNKNEFNQFSNIEIIDQPIKDVYYNGLKRIYTLASPEPGTHLWDFFTEEENESDALKVLKRYDYMLSDKPKMRNIFSKKILDSFNEIYNKNFKIDSFNSIHYRTLDFEDNLDFFESKKNKIIELLNNNENYFICTNNWNFKNWIKTLNKSNVLMYDIPGEKNYGNHYNYDKTYSDNKELFHERTKYVIYEMLTLLKSKHMFLFSCWGRFSNFYFLSRINNINYTLNP